MAKKSVYLEIEESQLQKWRQIWQPQDAWELAEITGFTDNTVRAIMRRGTAPNEKIIRDFETYFNKKLYNLSQLL